MKGNKCDYWQCSLRIGLFFIALFAVCFVWFYIQPAQSELHQALFELTFLGWSGMNFASFIVGAIQSFVWAYIFVGIWVLVGCCHNGKSGDCCGK